MKLTEEDRNNVKKLYSLVINSYDGNWIELRDSDGCAVNAVKSPPRLLREMIANTIAQYLLKSEENLK